MAKKSTHAHKRGQFKCKKCGHIANGPFKLGLHYKKYPSHASEKSIAQKANRHAPMERSVINMKQRAAWLEKFLSDRGEATPPHVVFDAARKESIGGTHAMRDAADLSKHITRYATGRGGRWTYTGPTPMKFAPKTTWEQTNADELPLEKLTPPKRAKRKGINFCPGCGEDLRDF